MRGRRTSCGTPSQTHLQLEGGSCFELDNQLVDALRVDAHKLLDKQRYATRIRLTLTLRAASLAQTQLRRGEVIRLFFERLHDR